MFRTIIARYPSKCPRCSGKIIPGQRIRYGGRGRSYHLAADCPGSGVAHNDHYAAGAMSAYQGLGGEDSFLDDDYARGFLYGERGE